VLACCTVQYNAGTASESRLLADIHGSEAARHNTWIHLTTASAASHDLELQSRRSLVLKNVAIVVRTALL